MGDKFNQSILITSTFCVFVRLSMLFLILGPRGRLFDTFEGGTGF